MTTPVKVYGPPGQPMAASVSRILTCLIEKEVPFELITVNMKTEPKKPQLLRTQVHIFAHFEANAIFNITICKE